MYSFHWPYCAMSLSPRIMLKLQKGDIQKETKIVMIRIGILLEIYPAWEAIEVANLPLGASIEISAIAYK